MTGLELTLLAVAYTAVALLVAVPATIWAREGLWEDPEALGLLLGVFWPLTLALALLAAVVGLLMFGISTAADALTKRLDL